MQKNSNLKLKKILNIRDLGGIKTADGKVIRRGKLMRSGRLSSMTRSTKRELLAMGDLTVIDLRLPTECNEHPDVILGNMRYISLPLMYTPTAGITHDKSSRITAKKESYRIREEFGTLDNYMVEAYRSILFNAEPQGRLKEFLRLVIESDGAVIFHCSSGKDRAGICAMLVESLLGADEETVIEDYAASKKYLKNRFLLNKFGVCVAPVSVRFKKILYAYMSIKREYMVAVLNDLKNRYGGVIQYCKTVLGVTDGDIDKLKEKYLV